MNPWNCNERQGRRAESHTSLSENTEEILSSWGIHMHRREFGGRADRSGAPDAEEDRKAVRFFAEHASTEQLLWTSSETLHEEDEDSTRSERNRSLPYVLIALVSGLLMVTAGSVLLNAKPTPDFSWKPNATYAGRRSPVHSVVASGRIAPALQAPREPTMAVGGAFENHGPPTFKMRTTESGSDSEERHLCGAVFYSYCPKPRSEFVFDPVMRTCIQARDHEVELCNQSPNRFHTRADCYSSCVQTERPSGKCFDRPAFAKCTRQDFKCSPWIFDGYACRPWHFPTGKCPSHNGHIFGDQRECTARCINGSLAASSACFTPGAQACPFKEFRFPYFAVPAAAGSKRLRCLRASVLRTLRCTSGTNGFGTAESCELACSGGSEDDQQ
ncbi:hypothetical protein MTO96_028845 [Rhipicephalus appendiculatus]